MLLNSGIVICKIYIRLTSIIQMKELFQGYIVKVWKGMNFGSEKYKIVNKEVVRHYIQYYLNCWKYRNEIFHNKEI